MIVLFFSATMHDCSIESGCNRKVRSLYTTCMNSPRYHDSSLRMENVKLVYSIQRVEIRNQGGVFTVYIPVIVFFSFQGLLEAIPEKYRHALQ
jgi:hypothetical protein